LFYGVSGEDLRQAFEARLQKREPAHDTLGEDVPDAVPAAANGHKPAAAA
jgi:hypothetical protein